MSAAFVTPDMFVDDAELFALMDMLAPFTEYELRFVPLPDYSVRKALRLAHMFPPRITVVLYVPAAGDKRYFKRTGKPEGCERLEYGVFIVGSPQTILHVHMPSYSKSRIVEERS